MSIDRPRLLIGSLVVALVASVVGGFVWATIVSDDGDGGVDARLVESGVVNEPTPDLAPIPDLSGESLPDVEVTDRNGNSVSTATFLGRPTVINFWFSTCVPCARELADFAEVDAEYGDDVRFVGINPQDSLPVMERFAGERGVTYDLYRDEIEFQTALDIAFFPYTIFVSPDGTIVEQTGVLDADGLREKVENLLETET